MASDTLYRLDSNKDSLVWLKKHWQLLVYTFPSSRPSIRVAVMPLVANTMDLLRPIQVAVNHCASNF